MERFTIRIAGQVIEVNALYASTRKFCKDYLCDTVADFVVETTPQAVALEQEITDREHIIEGLPIHKIDDRILERTALQREIAEMLFKYNTVLFHGSVIAVDGMAYLFTAQSGTGKSTHTRLWREMLGERAIMVNDDKPFLQVTTDGIQVFGSPWNGKHGLGNNIDVPLKTICILERGTQNEIAKIPASEAVSMLLQQSNRPQNPQLLPQYLDIIENIANKTTFYRLKCNMNPEAAELSYQTMSGKIKEN